MSKYKKGMRCETFGVYQCGRGCCECDCCINYEVLQVKNNMVTYEIYGKEFTTNVKEVDLNCDVVDNYNNFFDIEELEQCHYQKHFWDLQYCLNNSIAKKFDYNFEVLDFTLSDNNYLHLAIEVNNIKYNFVYDMDDICQDNDIDISEVSKEIYNCIVNDIAKVVK